MSEHPRFTQSTHMRYKASAPDFSTTWRPTCQRRKVQDLARLRRNNVCSAPSNAERRRQAGGPRTTARNAEMLYDVMDDAAVDKRRGDGPRGPTPAPTAYTTSDSGRHEVQKALLRGGSR